MADPDVLTNAFLATHPVDAARVLESMAGNDAAALFDAVPARLGAPALEAMRPFAAAKSLPRDDARAALLLGGVSVPAAAAVLRYLPEARRGALIDALPTPTAIACRALLGYSEDSVGAWVDSEIIALPPASRASDALDLLRSARVNASSPVYAVDAQRRPLGQVEIATLLRADRDARLELLMRDVTDTLPAATPLAGAVEHRVWSHADIAPVVERGGALVGVIERRMLRRMQRRRAARAAAVPGALTAVVAAGYWHAVASLIEATLTMLSAPPERRK